MKNIIIRTLILVAVCFSFAVLTGCNINAESKLVGKYMNTGIPNERLELLSDYTGVLFVVNEKEQIALKWSILDDGRIKLTSNTFGIEKMYFGKWGTSKKKNDRLVISFDGVSEQRYEKFPKELESKFHDDFSKIK